MTVYPLAPANDDRRQFCWLLWNASPFAGGLTDWVYFAVAREQGGPWWRRYPMCPVPVSPTADRLAKGFRLCTFTGRPTVNINQAYHRDRVPHGLWLLGDAPAD